MSLARNFMVVAGLALTTYAGDVYFNARRAATGELAKDYARAAQCDSNRRSSQPCSSDENDSVKKRDANENLRHRSGTAATEAGFGTIIALAAVAISRRPSP